jgi:DNA polymerase I-like protein with 3'-5' exonuclease and polymerase domains
VAKKEPWVPDPDPDFEQMAVLGYSRWRRHQPDVISFDCETTGLAYYDTAFCVQFGWIGPDGVESHYFELEKFDSSIAVREIFESGATLVGHHTKFDLQKCILGGLLRREDVTPERIHDTEAQSQGINEHQPKALKTLAVDLLKYDDIIEVPIKSGKNAGTVRKVSRELHELKAAKEWAKKQYGIGSIKEVGYHLIPRSILVPYAIKDTDFTIRLHEMLWPRVQHHEDMLAWYRQEMEVSLVLLDMETAGMRSNVPYVKEQIRVYTKRMIHHDLAIEKLTGKTVGKDTKAGEFNPGSNDQIREYFTTRGHSREKYDRANLKTITDHLAPLLIERRKDDRILGTYFRAMDREVGTDGVLHPSFRQHGTVTGRMSSGESEG